MMERSYWNIYSTQFGATMGHFEYNLVVVVVAGGDLLVWFVRVASR